MKPTTILVVAIWIFVVVGNILNALLISSAVFAGVPELPWLIVFMPLVVVFGAFAKRENFIVPVIEKWVDQHSRPGTYREFMNALKLELMFAAMCFGICVAAFARRYFLGSPALPSAVVSFFAGGGFAFVAAYFIRRWRAASETRQAK
jgi:hypothetical protein